MHDPAPSAPSEGKNNEPLLPALLLSPAALLWLWGLPLVVLLLLNWQGYQLIEGNMDAAQHRSALELGLAGVGNLFAGVATFFALASWLKRNPDPAIPVPIFPIVGGAIVLVQVTYLWLAMNLESQVLPATVTTWIYPSGRFAFNQFAFAMVPLFYGVLLLSCAWHVENARRALWISLSLAAGAPVVLFLLAHFLVFKSDFYGVIFAVGLVLLGLVMFVGIIRVLMVGLKSGRRFGPDGERIAIVVTALVLPIAGLLLNRTIDFPVDFQAWEVYALVVANTAILLFASCKQREQPLLSFGLLCFTLPFTLYFFIVFLPYLLLSILAVIVVGVGFLVLTPTILLVLHLSLLNEVVRGPLAKGRKFSTALIGVACCLLLPAYFTARALADKAALNAALDYVYTPTVSADSATYPSSVINLKRALKSHRNYKNGIYYPLLSDYYSWLVFDNLVLPDNKLAQLETVFFGSAGSKENVDPVHRRDGPFRGSSVRELHRALRVNSLPHNVTVADAKITTHSVGEKSLLVTLALTLRNEGQINAEYVASLPLPSGIFVAGLRLHMHGVPVAGRIFEKKTALWVYSMIRDSERRDPALLTYTAPNEIELRVFPVSANESSMVEIDFLLPSSTVDVGIITTKDPASILTSLGRSFPVQTVPSETGIELAGSLPQESASPDQRGTYLHVIVDRSIDNGFDGDLAAALRKLKEKFPSSHLARITAVNYAVDDVVRRLTPIDELIARPVTATGTPLQGGLFLDLALAHALKVHRDVDLDASAGLDALPLRPIFVVLSHHAGTKAPPLELTGRWAPLVDHLEVHEIGEDGATATLVDQIDRTHTWLRLGQSIRLADHGASFANRDDSSNVEFWLAIAKQWRPLQEVQRQPASAKWAKAALLQRTAAARAQNPGGTSTPASDLVQASRESGVLLPISSYIVVENAAQWRMLAQAEKQKLGQNPALEFVETPAPSVLYVGLGFALFLLIRHRRKVLSLVLET